MTPPDRNAPARRRNSVAGLAGAQAGYRLADEKTTLPYQYVLIFQRAEATPGAVTR